MLLSKARCKWEKHAQTKKSDEQTLVDIVP